MKKQISILTICLLLFPLITHAELVDPSFSPHKLIEDRVFSDIQTFGGAEGIQKFLESKNSVLANTNPAFLEKLKEPDVTMLKTALEDPRPSLPRKRTAAELIWDASQSSGLNPQVLLVTLQKEQGLITNHQSDTPEQLQPALNFALGFDCPVSSGCSQSFFPGFYYQLFGNLDSSGNRYLGAAHSLMKSFNTLNGRGPAVDGKISRVGDVVTLGNTLGGYEGVPEQSQVTLQNKATAALYRYTPHVFNGNYNFVKFFATWFKYPNGTLIKLANDANTYIIQNGTRQLVPAFVAAIRKLDTANTIVVSPTEVANYPQDKVYGPADNTIVKIASEEKPYVFISNIRHPASTFVLQQRGLDPAASLSITPAESALFEQGSVLVPKDGTVLKGQSSKAYYIVDNDVLKLFSDFTLKQRGASKLAVVVSDDELATYQKQGYVAPLDNSLVRSKSAQTVYLIEKGLKRPVTTAVFKNRALSVKQVATITDEEVSALPIGAYATPKEKSFYKVTETGDIFYFKDGTKHPISAFVAKQQHIRSDYSFSLAENYEWQDGIAVPPKDGTLLKSDKSGTVFVVEKKQLRPLTAIAFKNRKYKAKQVVTLAQGEIDSYVLGDIISK